jgi:predicted nucleic acid-binding protein
MTNEAVLLDTSFFIRLLNDIGPLCKNADEYFQFFLDKKIQMMISTISIAEYCVDGVVSELPLNNLLILPFNFDHAKRAGELAKIVFSAKKKGQIDVCNRTIIPNDTNLFAQADSDVKIKYFLSSDKESLKIYNLLLTKIPLNFQFIDLNNSYHEYFGYLNF